MLLRRVTRQFQTEKRAEREAIRGVPRALASASLARRSHPEAPAVFAPGRQARRNRRGRVCSSVRRAYFVPRPIFRGDARSRRIPSVLRVPAPPILSACSWDQGSLMQPDHQKPKNRSFFFGTDAPPVTPAAEPPRPAAESAKYSSTPPGRCRKEPSITAYC